MPDIFTPRHPQQTVLRGPNGSRSEMRQTSVARLPRTQGRASFLEDFIQLRKTLLLCHFCAKSRMPRNWTAQHDYEEVSAWHSIGACDLCRSETSLTVFVPTEGAYWKGVMSRC